ncbi:Hypothetical protein, putative [Bodo saltans]|uniref:Uncharacterized protein n=1 Tax=Bodo saltans TaxID=75058 RepID=A0A0S4JXX3_BODSA|nr:Hypothetical protein, putative [Bodo saltans]|eukprot:CUG93997.1 Hypothetical protein, putative [Bodo saltans]
MSVTPPRALKLQQPQAQQHPTTSLVEVVAALIPLIDQFPHLQWKGSITGEDFVELWFPFIADYVQNGLYDPPAYITASGGAAAATTSPSRQQQRLSPSQQHRNAAGGGASLWRGVSPSKVVRARSPPSSSPLKESVAAKPPKSLASFLNSAAFAATRERANSLTTSPATKQFLNSGSGTRSGSTSLTNVAALTSAPSVIAQTADPNTVASVIVLRSFASAATSLVMYQLKLLDFDLEIIVSNSVAKRRESMVPAMLPSFLTGAAGGGGVLVTSPSRRKSLTSPERSPDPPSRRAFAAMDRSGGVSSNVVSFALGSVNALLQSFNPDEDSCEADGAFQRDLTSAEGAKKAGAPKAEQSLGSRLFSPQPNDDNNVEMLGDTTLSLKQPSRKSNVRFSNVLDNSGNSDCGDTSGLDFFSNHNNNSRRSVVASNNKSVAASGTAELEFLNAKDSIQGESRSRLIREIQRIWSTPKGRRPGLFAKEQYQSFQELKIFVETLLSALYSSAAELPARFDVGRGSKESWCS